MEALKLNKEQAYSVVNSIVKKNKLNLNVVLSDLEDTIYIEFDARNSEVAAKVARLFSSRYPKNEQDVVDKDLHNMYLVNKGKVYYSDVALDLREKDVLGDEDDLSDILNDAIQEQDAKEDSELDAEGEWFHLLERLSIPDDSVLRLLTDNHRIILAGRLNTRYDAGKLPLTESVAKRMVEQVIREESDDTAFQLLRAAHAMHVSAGRVSDNAETRFKINRAVIKYSDSEDAKALTLLHAIDDGYALTVATSIFENIVNNLDELVEEEQDIDKEKQEGLDMLEEYGVDEDVIEYIVKHYPDEKPNIVFSEMSDAVNKVIRKVQSEYFKNSDITDERLIRSVERRGKEETRKQYFAHNIASMRNGATLFCNLSGDLKSVERGFVDYYDNLVFEYRNTHPEPVPNDETVVTQRQGYLDKIDEMKTNKVNAKYIQNYESDLLKNYNEQLTILIQDKAHSVVEEYKNLFLNK